MYEYDQITPIDSTDIWRERAAQCNDMSQTEENKLGNRFSVYGGLYLCVCNYFNDRHFVNFDLLMKIADTGR